MSRAAHLSPAVELEGAGKLKGLLLPYKHVYRAAVHGPVVADLVLKETAIRLLDILRQVGIEHERGDLCVRDLRAILDLDILALGRWWRISLDERQHHLVELGCAHLRCAVLINLLCELQHLEAAAAFSAGVSFSHFSFSVPLRSFLSSSGTIATPFFQEKPFSLTSEPQPTV